MSTLIIFAGYKGTSREAARKIADSLEQEYTLCDLRSESAPPLEAYNTIILGGSIRAGRLPKPLLDYMTENRELLKEKRRAFFICCLQEENAGQYFEANIPEALRAGALGTYCLGGRLVMKEHNFIIRAMLAKIRGSKGDVNAIRWDKIGELAAAVEGKASL